MSFDEELDYFENNPFYTKTNENIFSILHGLNVNRNDNILSIMGSGDQGFAMISYDAKVELIDIEDRQIQLVFERYKYLKKGDINNFLKSEYGIYDNPRIDLSRNKFLKTKFNLIKNNLENLIIEKKPTNILDKIKKNGEKYNKIYLSNINYTFKEEMNIIINISKKLKKKSLIYSSFIIEKNIKKNKYFKINKNLTKIAKKHNKNNIWNPVVFEVL